MSRAGTSIFSDELERFQAEVRRLAMQIVEDVLRRELGGRKIEPLRRGRKPAAVAAPAATGRKRGRPPKAEAATGKRGKLAKAEPAKRGRKPRKGAGNEELQLQLGLIAESAAASDAAVAESASASAVANPAAPSGPPAPSALHTGKRRKWTRESIIEELARWLVNGTAVDASFLTRNGPPGLAAAARRIFGRFDAALNVAGLHVTKLYPDGPPPKPGSQLPGAQQFR